MADLRERLRRTRWPEQETVADGRQGVPLEAAKTLCAYWRDEYDWRRCEAALNRLGQFRTEIDGLEIHFIHQHSAEPCALPLIMTHGWPGSIIKFHKVIGPLVDPVAHGGNAEDAFHVVLPSLPGYGFSDKPGKPGWSVERIARAWIDLMERLRYGKCFAQGGDWGSAVTDAIATTAGERIAGIHLNMVVAHPDESDLAVLTDRERAAVESFSRHMSDGGGYSHQQCTRPQTLGYGLTDSPAGQAAWIYEKFVEWTDCDGDPTRILTID